MRTRRELAQKILAGLLLGGAVVTLASGFGGFTAESRNAPASAAAATKEDAARAAFLAAYPVFMHPRCLNCHPMAEAPLQGDDSHPHAQNVQRQRRQRQVRPQVHQLPPA